MYVCVGDGGDRAVEGQATTLGVCLSRIRGSRSDSLVGSEGSSQEWAQSSHVLVSF